MLLTCFHFCLKDLKYISQYLPNNKCNENIDHHDHENEIEHLHKHRAALKSSAQIPNNKVTMKGSDSSIYFLEINKSLKKSIGY